MRILRDLKNLAPENRNAAVALGNFDGVHLGHRAILEQTIASARLLGAPSAVMTFQPHPREFFKPDAMPLRILPMREKLARLRDAGIDIVYLLRFDSALAGLSAQEFMQSILANALSARQIVTGYNFAFGKGREGNTASLSLAAQRLGFQYTACPPVTTPDAKAISSSAVRECLARGDMAGASALLGYAYYIAGYVRPGRKLGRELGYPTANIALDQLFRPRYGIYAAQFRLEGEAQWRAGIVNIGINPSIDGDTQPLLELHAFDFEGDLYGQYLEVKPLDFIRPEAKFDSLDALRSQIAQDCVQAKAILRAKETA